MKNRKHGFKVEESIYIGDGLKDINKINFQGCLALVILIYAFIFIMMAFGQPSPINLPVFIILNFFAYLPSLIVYFKDRSSRIYKILLMCGFFVMYAFLMFDTDANLVSMLIIAPLVMLILYHDVLFSFISSVLTVLINLAFVAYRFFEAGANEITKRDGGFQILMIVLFALATVSATFYYADSYKKNTMYTEVLENKNMELASITLQTIETLSSAIDAKDHYTEGHSQRVSEYAVEIAREMGIEGDELNFIKYSALLHDVGKISVPDSVLNKPAKLNEKEFSEMKGHTTSGGNILGMISTIPGISNSAMYHHERFDGKGYPHGLSGNKIPKSARIIALADAYDAMTSDRVYRNRLDEEKVLNEIKNGAGSQWDPEVVDAFFSYLNHKE